MDGCSTPSGRAHWAALSTSELHICMLLPAVWAGLAVLTHLPHSHDPVNGKVLLRRLSSSSCARHGCDAIPPSACRAVSQAFCSSSEDT